MCLPQGKLSPCTPTTEPTCCTTEAGEPRACAPQEKPQQRDACTLQLESSPCLPQLEESLCASEDPAQLKRNKEF